MANPDFRAEAGGDQAGTASATVNFTGLTWAANDIICILVATDGYVPTLSTANGFAIAQDPQGNSASVTTNAGTPGTAECGLFLFWKRAVGSTTAADPEPVLAAPTGGGTTWCLETNSYLGARTKGTPWHIITTGIVSSATTAVAPPAVTPTLNSVLVMPCAASSNDDQAFNNWTLTGAASPAGQIDSGWHSGSGNACAFNGGRGGYATTGGARSGSTTFAAATKQAQFTLVMAALDEFELDEGSAQRVVLLPPPATMLWPLAADEIPGTAATILDDDIGPPQLRSALPPQVITWSSDGDDLPSATTASVLDEDPQLTAVTAPPLLVATQRSADDDLPIAATATVDEDGPLTRWFAPPLVTSQSPPSGDELAGIAQPTGIDEDATLVPSLPAAPRLPLVFPVAAEELVAPSTSGIGGAGDQQRSLSQPNQTGTLTTVAPVTAWTTSLAVVVDPSQGGANRVTNGGNLYQCRTGGTTASSGGGPSGTGTSISDGSAVWYFVGPAQGTNTASGSQVLASVMRGTQSQAASIDPTDNDSGAFTVITNNAYANFTASFAGVWRRNTASNAKTNYTVSGVWGGSGGAGDEMSIGWVELQGVAVGAPHAFSQVERLSSSGGAVTAAAITTTVPCVIVSYWFGNGTVQAQGVPDAATPAGGLTLVAGCTGPLSLTPNGYIQHMVAWRKAAPGTFAEVWTASPTDEGAQLVTVAFQDLGTPTTITVDDDRPAPPPRVVAFFPPFQLAPAPDELAVTTIEDDQLLPTSLSPPPPAQLVGVRSDDEILPAIVDEDAAQVPVSIAPVPALTQRVDSDELPVASVASIIDEDAAPAPVRTVPIQLLPILPQSDELATPVVAAVIDEDGTPPAVPVAPAWALSFPVQVDEFVLAAVATLDEDSQIALLLANAMPATVQLPQSDETIPSALDDAAQLVVPLPTPTPLPIGLATEDEFQGTFTPPPASMIDEDGPQPRLPWPVPPPGWYLMSVDELAIALSVPSLTKHVRVVVGSGPAALIVNNAPTVIIVEEPNV